MRRFPQTALLDQWLTAGKLELRHLDAQRGAWRNSTALFPPLIRYLTGNTGAGATTEAGQFQPHPTPCWSIRLSSLTLADVEPWTLNAFSRLHPLLAERKAGGWIREGHGDLHLGNMVLTESGQVMIFRLHRV